MQPEIIIPTCMPAFGNAVGNKYSGHESDQQKNNS